jgi:transposase
MLKMVDVEFIRKKHFVEGWSIRKISERCEVSRQAVRKALGSAEVPRYRLGAPRPSPVMDAYRGVVEGWLADDAEAPRKQRHTAKRVYDRLVAEHRFGGAESTVRRYVARLQERAPEVFIPLTAGFGQQAQVDWGQAEVVMGGAAVTAHLFCARLRASGVPFVWAAPTEKLEAFGEGHRRCFEWWGGVPAECVYDNPKTAVARILAGPEREEHTWFASLRAHYLFDSHFCRPARGNEKGGVENLVGYARRNALVPVPAVADWDELNALLLAWCEGELARAGERGRADLAGLRALPAQAFRCAVVRAAPVSRLSLVRVDHNRYSVPCRLVGRTVAVALFSDRVEVQLGAETVATHPRAYGRGEMRLALDHYLPALARKPRAARHAAVVEQLPPLYARVRDRLCAADRQGYREFCAVLLLHREFPAPAVAAALAEAERRGCLTAGAVRQLLLNRAAPAKPEALALPEALAGARLGAPDLRQYDRLSGTAHA